MNVEELSKIGPNVDLETVDSIHKKRLLAFINHFVINTASFLNKLSKSCEQKFMLLENKMQKLEASLIILESKLNSVPGLDVEVPEEKAPVVKAPVAEKSEVDVVKEEEKPIMEDGVSSVVESERPALDPSLIKYVKMLQFGVPQPAVRAKMTLEGVDPSLHDEILNYK